MRLTVASYNIHGCLGWDGHIDPVRIAEIIGELDAEIIALQEVVNSNGRNGKTQLERLSGLTGMHGVAGLTLCRADTPCGIALLTRHPVLAVRHHDLSVPGHEPRGALDADIDVDGEPVRVICTHLGLRLRERRHQIGQLLAILSEIQRDTVTVLLGDINEWLPWAAALRRLNAHFGKASAPRTFPALLPLLALDRLWVGGGAALGQNIAVYKTPVSRIASDHLPLRADIVLASSLPNA